MSVRAFVTTLFCFAALIIITSLLMLSKPTGVERLDARPKEVPGKDLSYHEVYIQTIKHDGHMLISAQTITASGGASIMHHPDCNCLKPKER